jgi:hypothetical protein
MKENMLSYKEYEKQVYDWLMTKHNADENFTFSLRQKGSKGVETDYFIGTETSKYFSMTFWNMPVGFPGSSGDSIGLIFEYTKTGYHYFIDFNQTASPEDNQNISVLNLLKSLKNDLSTFPGLMKESTEKNKMYNLRTKTNKSSYDSVEEMLVDIDKDLEYIIPLVNEHIEREKRNNPDFVAHRISPVEFKNLQDKMEVRFEKFLHLNNDDELIATEGVELDFATFLKKFKEEDVITYFDFLKEIINKFNLKQGDKRLQFSYRNNGLRLTIGQRYSWYLNNSDKKGKFGVLSKDKLNESSELFSGVKPIPYFSHFDDFNISESDKKSIFEGLKAQLEITSQSGYRKHNSAIFETTAFHHNIGNPIEIKQMETAQTIATTPISSAPLNQILYGPPGTGKTYNTVLEAAKIVTGNEAISYDEALDIFNTNLGNQIEFITFHQNYSYEDFIQGIRPDTENGDALTFEKKDGVFKKIADKALKNLIASENPASAKKDFDVVFQDLIQPLNDGDVEEIEIKMKKSSFFITAVGEKSIEFRKSIGDSEHTLSINTLRKMYDRGVNDLVLGGLQQYYNPFLELLSEKGKSQVVAIERKNYVIIIDEINRANISRVFGELITLIEEDKRSNGKIPMRVTLPSGDAFVVPSNLYIIGTMNTADKSIALLDIALRRRFEFIAMYPDDTIVNDEFREIFIAINKAILQRKNHDFTIGHAYFMGEDCKLEKIINNKVIPLLMEYFMNDEKEVTAILQEAKITIGGWPIKMMV